VHCWGADLGVIVWCASSDAFPKSILHQCNLFSTGCMCSKGLNFWPNEMIPRGKGVGTESMYYNMELYRCLCGLLAPVLQDSCALDRSKALERLLCMQAGQKLYQMLDVCRKM
jgi:hypothetical protein